MLVLRGKPPLHGRKIHDFHEFFSRV